MNEELIPYFDNEDSLIDELNILYQKRLIYKELLKEKNKSFRISLSKEQRLRVFEKTSGQCHVCGAEINLNSFQADHVKPFSSGGNDIVDNFLPACSQCNNYRWDYSPSEIQWILKLGVWLKTKIQTKSEEGLCVLPSLIRDEIKREKRRKNPRLSKNVHFSYKDLLPVKGKLDFGAKAVTYTEIEKAWQIIENYIITDIETNDCFFQSKSFLLTGETNISRDKLENYIHSRGGIVKKTITSDLDYLLIGNFYGYSKIIRLNEINATSDKNILIVLSKKIEITFVNSKI